MRDLFVALALVLVIEGVLWALFPNAMKRAAAAALHIEEAQLRYLGLAAATLGVVLVWWLRG